MNLLIQMLVALIALEHIAILYLEMFLWTKPAGLKRFRMTQDVANASAGLAKNMGLYNGFLAAGLIWGLVAPDPAVACSVKTFFLSCVSIAGIFGAATAVRRIFYVQALPALVALGLLLLSNCA